VCPSEEPRNHVVHAQLTGWVIQAQLGLILLTRAGLITGLMYMIEVDSPSMTGSMNISETVLMSETGTGVTAASTCTVRAGS
jgi:hypothetical protein